MEVNSEYGNLSDIHIAIKKIYVQTQHYSQHYLTILKWPNLSGFIYEDKLNFGRSHHKWK